MTIQIQFGPHRISAALYQTVDDDGSGAGKLALFATHAGQVGFGASVLVGDEGTAAKLRKLGYRSIKVEKPRAFKCRSRQRKKSSNSEALTGSLASAATGTISTA